MINIRNAIIGMCATNTYFVWNDENNEGVIIDPAGDPQRIFDRVNKYGFKVVAVLLTHGHFDHVLALEEVREHYGVKAYAGVNERAVLSDSNMNLTGPFLGEGITYEADIYIKHNEEFEVAGMKVRALEVPGHTPGGMCYYFTEHNVVFSGDTLFAGSVGRSDFPGGSGRALVLGIRDSLYALDDATVVYPGHGDDTTVGYEKIHNPFAHM